MFWLNSLGRKTERYETTQLLNDATNQSLSTKKDAASKLQSKWEVFFFFVVLVHEMPHSHWLNIQLHQPTRCFLWVSRSFARNETNKLYRVNWRHARSRAWLVYPLCWSPVHAHQLLPAVVCEHLLTLPPPPTTSTSSTYSTPHVCCARQRRLGFRRHRRRRPCRRLLEKQ